MRDRKSWERGKKCCSAYFCLVLSLCVLVLCEETWQPLWPSRATKTRTNKETRGHTALTVLFVYLKCSVATLLANEIERVQETRGCAVRAFFCACETLMSIFYTICRNFSSSVALFVNKLLSQKETRLLCLGIIRNNFLDPHITGLHGVSTPCSSRAFSLR